MDIQHFKQTFDVAADAWVEKKLAEYPHLVIDDQVLSYISHSGALIHGGGKRIRPYLCTLMYEACGGKEQQKIIQAGLAIELFHTFALIHDDIIDHGDMRRDVQTTHIAVRDILMRNHRAGDIDHVANGQAMLVGDLVYLWVFEVFQSLTFSEAEKTRAFSYLTCMINEVIVGEMIDVDITTRDSVSDELIYQKTLLKTATYTFVRPMQIGAILAGAGEDIVRFCERFGSALGMAFQIQDDLFDITKSPEELHKRVLSDIEERQHTYFTQYILTEGTEKEKEKLLSYFGKPISPKHQGDVVALFESSGAVAYGKVLMNKYFDEALSEIETIPLRAEYAEGVRELVLYIKHRVS